MLNRYFLNLAAIGVSLLGVATVAQAADSSAVYAGFSTEETSKYAYLGGVYALNGDIATEGMVLRGQVARGIYKYDTAAVTGGDVNGSQTRENAGVGYQWVNNNFRTSVYAGLDIQHHVLSPRDSANEVSGQTEGAIAQAEIETGATPVYFAGIANYSTAFETYWVRLRGGLPVGDKRFGVEGTGSGNLSHDSTKAGFFALLPVNKKVMLDLNTGYFETNGDRSRGDSHGIYVGINIGTQF